MSDCKHDWHFVQGLTERLRCTRCGQMTWPKDADEKVQELLADVLTVGSAWSRGGKRIDPASVFKDHGDIHSCSYHCDRPECIKAQRDELRDRLAQPEQEPVSWEDVLGAIARGWTHEDNKHKTIDVQLAVAIAKEVQDMVIAPPQRKPLNKPITKKEWMEYLEKTWDASQEEALAQPEQKPVPWESFFNRYCPWLEQPKQEKKT